MRGRAGAFLCVRVLLDGPLSITTLATLTSFGRCGFGLFFVVITAIAQSRYVRHK